MSTYPVPELLSRWSKGEFTADQATGHLLQNLLALHQRVNELEKRLRQLEQSAGKPAS